MTTTLRLPFGLTAALIEHGEDMAARPGTAHHSAKLNAWKVRNARRWYSSGRYTLKEIADRYNVAPNTIGAVVRGETWKHVQ